MRRFGLVVRDFVLFACLSAGAAAQPAPGGPPAVGVVRAERQQITESDEFIGRIQAVNRVALIARVTAFLDKRVFVEGAEVKKGDLLYVLELPPFQAQVDAAKASIEQFEAQHRNAELTIERAQALLAIPRAAVLSDQQGDYVYVVDNQNKAQVRRIQQGQSTPSIAVITNGLNEGELVISEGLQRVRPGEAVSPSPATPGPQVGISSEAAPPSGEARPSAEAPGASQ